MVLVTVGFRYFAHAHVPAHPFDPEILCTQIWKSALVALKLKNKILSLFFMYASYYLRVFRQVINMLSDLKEPRSTVKF